MSLEYGDIIVLSIVSSVCGGAFIYCCYKFIYNSLRLFNHKSDKYDNFTSNTEMTTLLLIDDN